MRRSPLCVASLMLLLALAAVPSTAETDYPWGWVPGQVIILIKDASLDQLDWDALLRGELRTGLASLDSLIAGTGVLGITPGYPEGGKLRVHLLQFAEGIDVLAMVALYEQNEHAEASGPNSIGRTAVGAASWSLVKRAASGTRAGAMSLPSGGPMATPCTPGSMSSALSIGGRAPSALLR